MIKNIRVEYHANQQTNKVPKRFYIGARKIEVTEVVDRWLDPQHSYFKLHGHDGGIYILRHNIGLDSWELVFFENG